MSRRRLVASLTLPAALVTGLAAVGVAPHDGAAQGSDASLQEAAADTVPSFEADVLPIFRARCAECHGGEQGGEVITEAYLNLMTHEGVMAGSEYGTVIEPGNPDDSVLYGMIESGEMPEEGEPVSPEELEVIRAWIEAGAPDN